jgi:hypothetical protein
MRRLYGQNPTQTHQETQLNSLLDHRTEQFLSSKAVTDGSGESVKSIFTPFKGINGKN